MSWLLGNRGYDIAQTSEGYWQARVVAYFYAIEHEGAELLAYHWHPRGRSQVTRPHLHVRADIQLGEHWLGKVHLPTGAINLEDIVALTINELGAEPLREDWERLIPIPGPWRRVVGCLLRVGCESEPGSRREVGPLQAAAPGPVQAAAPTISPIELPLDAGGR